MRFLKAVLIGCNESEIGHLQRELQNLNIQIQSTNVDLKQVWPDHQLISESDSFFLVRVNCLDHLDTIRRLAQSFQGKPIVALMNEDIDCTAMLHTLWAGAAQIVPLPLTSTNLRASVAAIALQLGHVAGPAKVIAVAGVTEGCGATSLAINLGYELAAQFEIHCILTEPAVHVGRLAVHLNLDVKQSVHDLLTGAGTLDADAIKSVLAKVAERFEVLPGPSRNIGTAGIVPERIQTLIGQLRQMTDIVLLDLPGVYDDGYFDTLLHADRILLVGEQSVPSIHDLKLVKETLDQRKCTAPTWFVIDKYDPTKAGFGYERIQQILGTSSVFAIAADRRAFRDALNKGLCLRQQAPRCRALADIDALAESFLDRGHPVSPSAQHYGPMAWLARLVGKLV
jgi:pilus assembly protein CpaE